MPLSLLRYVNVPFSHHDCVPVQELVRTGLVVGGTSCSFRLWADAAAMKPQPVILTSHLNQAGLRLLEDPKPSGGLQIPSSAINGHLFWIRAAGALPKEGGGDALPGTNYPSITGCARTFTPRAKSASVWLRRPRGRGATDAGQLVCSSHNPGTF